MNCCCENCGWSEIVGSPIMCNYNGRRTWRDECCEAWKPKEEETNSDKITNIEWIRKISGETDPEELINFLASLAANSECRYCSICSPDGFDCTSCANYWLYEKH